MINDNIIWRQIMQIFIFRSLCIKLVDLRMNLYQEAALSFKMFGDSCLKP